MVSKALASLSPRSRKLIYFIAALIVLLLGSVLAYKIVCEHAFRDRGIAASKLAVIHRTSASDQDAVEIKKWQPRLECGNPNKIMEVPRRGLGKFPKLFENTVKTCNNFGDFVGYDGFLNAFLYGEERPGLPATSDEKTNKKLTPGLNGLKELLGRGEKYRDVRFYWWLLPGPFGTSNRGFRYALYQGDFVPLLEAARTRGIQFLPKYLEAIKTLLAFQGWNVETDSVENSFSFDNYDILVMKTWMSLKCVRKYTNGLDRRSGLYEEADFLMLVRYTQNLEKFMKHHVIRYPLDFTC